MNVGSQVCVAARELATKHGRLGFGHTTQRFEEKHFEFAYGWQDNNTIDLTALRRRARRRSICKTMYEDKCNAAIGIISKTSSLKALDDIWHRGRYDLTCETAISVAFAQGARRALGDRGFKSACKAITLSVYLSFDPRFVTVREDSGGAAEPKEATPELRKALRPGDGVYFYNPDVRTVDYWYVGENAIYLGNDQFAAWPLGVMSFDDVIGSLNEMRKPDASKSAYLAAYYQRVDTSALTAAAG